MKGYRVAVITPTIGTKHLAKCLDSVAKQTYENMEHIIVVDGPDYIPKTQDMLAAVNSSKGKVIYLPQNTGHSNYNGHRIYGAVPYLIDADYFIYLDEDNWIEPNHVESLIKTAQDTDWAFSFRKIVDQEGKFICNDDCESLGMWPTCLSTSASEEYFVDVGSYFLPKALAIQISPAWYRRARHPQEQPEVDRLIMQILLQKKYNYNTSKEYSLNYRVGNRNDSVQAKFFLDGNKAMLHKYNGELPWKDS